MEKIQNREGMQGLAEFKTLPKPVQKDILLILELLMADNNLNLPRLLDYGPFVTEAAEIIKEAAEQIELYRKAGSLPKIKQLLEDSICQKPKH